MVASVGWNSEDRVGLISPCICLDVAGGWGWGLPSSDFPLRILSLEAGVRPEQELCSRVLRAPLTAPSWERGVPLSLHLGDEGTARPQPCPALPIGPGGGGGPPLAGPVTQVSSEEAALVGDEPEPAEAPLSGPDGCWLQWEGLPTPPVSVLARVPYC